MMLEELENKILDGDFDEYTLDKYNSEIRKDQYKIDLEKAVTAYCACCYCGCEINPNKCERLIEFKREMM